jgi:predicted nucleic acid-binding protein
VIISAAEKTEIFGPKQALFFTCIDERRIEAVTSEFTLAECLVKPFADKDIFAVERYNSFLSEQSGFPVIPVTRQILLSAAQLRAETGLKLPDAIHVATAKWAGCIAFVTGDRRIKHGNSMRVVLWDQLSEADFTP